MNSVQEPINLNKKKEKSYIYNKNKNKKTKIENKLVDLISLNSKFIVGIGMFYDPDTKYTTSLQERYGYPKRDRVRLDKLRDILNSNGGNYNVISLSLERDPVVGYHICQNFNRSHTLEKNILKTFPNGEVNNKVHRGFLDWHNFLVSNCFILYNL